MERFLEIKEIDLLKRQLIKNYIYLKLFILGTHAFIFYFLAENPRFSYYSFLYFCIIAYTWLLIKKNYNIKAFVHFYFIIGIIFRFIIISSLWKYSMASGIWLFPVILGAYIFLEKKYVYIYTGVILTGMFLINFLSDQFTIYHLEFDTCRQMILSDSFIFISNISVFCLLLYYRDKIINVQNTYCTEYMIESEKCNLYKKESCMDYEESKKYENIFLDIKRVVEDGCYYENPDFNIAQLAALLKINTGYISRAIKVSGYDNFNHYLNSCRIERVKKIIKKQDFNKITMMYVYTAAGFSNQSTFNRAFKKIEGITPSQYLNSLEEGKGNE